jgi:hypothetical protein
MTPDLENAQHSFIKLLVCMQAGLELMDNLEGTSLYRQEVKQVLRNTSKVLSKKLDGAYKFINDEEKEETLRSIDRAIHSILDTSVENLFAEGYLPQTNTQL